jgi:iron-sulfur cluster repair protein YtfE (RIC family)
MRNGSIEQQSVDQVIARIPGASGVLRSYGIDPNSRMSLALAAAAVSATPDALLAELEERSMRLARRQAAEQRQRLAQQTAEEQELLELEVGA